MITPVSGATTSNPTAHVAPAANVPPEVKAPQVAQQDQVSVSKLAQKLASDGDTQAQEARESGAERASETARNKA